MEARGPGIRGLKRNSIDDTDIDFNMVVEEISTIELPIDNSKRFKGPTGENQTLVVERNNTKLFSHFAGIKDVMSENMVSPMTKIVNDLANLKTSKNEYNLKRNKEHLRNEDALVGKLADPVQENDDANAASCDSHQLPHTVGDSSISPSSHQRHSNMDTSMQDMAIDDLSFYEDDDVTPQTDEFEMPARLETGRLLSPEGSPRHFRIIERPICGRSVNPLEQLPLQQLNNQQSMHTLSQKKLIQQRNIENASSTSNSTNTSSNTPAQNFRIFHSLSSGSMESSMDDDYMELFEMESFDQASNNQYNFNVNLPSNLNSLISGTIKNASPAANTIHSANSTNALNTNRRTPRRPSVRRCLSMTENNQLFSQPKTPEILKQKTAATSSNTPAKNTVTPFSLRLTSENSEATTTTTPLSKNYNFKRPDPPSAIASPIQTKRYRHVGGAIEKENLDDSFRAITNKNVNATTTTLTTSSRHLLKKSMSMNDAEILSALARSDCDGQPDLIGDFSKPFALPLMDGRHRDLKSISSQTVARLIKGEFGNDIGNYQIIDCRYPYEFEGGHIRGAKNLYTHEQIVEEFLTKQKTELQQANHNNSNSNGETTACNKRNIIIFHCEFSSERGPKLSRFLRQNDRARNTNSYPALDYPEIYLLHNGYKDFYETHSELCDPSAYRPMLEPSFNEEYRHFRAKSKSWNGDGIGGTVARPRKTRSRLML